MLVSAPLYVLLATDVGGEARFASAVARRLQALGALTKGDRRAELGALETFHLDSSWGKLALKALLARAYEGVDGGEAEAVCAALDQLGAADAREREKMEVRTFLNRMIGLPVDGQKVLFEAFSERLGSVVWAARKDGRYDEGITDVSGSSVALEEEEVVVWTDPVSGAKTKTALVRVDRGVGFEEAKRKLAVACGEEQPVGGGERGGDERGVDVGRVGDGEGENTGGSGDEEDLVDFIVEEKEAGQEDSIWYDDDDDGEETGQVDSIVDDEDEEDEEHSQVSLIVDDDEEEDGHLNLVVEEEQQEANQVDSIATDNQDDKKGDLAQSEAVVEASKTSLVSPKPTEANKAAASRSPRKRACEKLDGFYRSRFTQAGKQIYMLALSKADSTGRCLLTRPNTGPSPFVEEWADITRKYAKITADEARAGWTAAFDSACHSQTGGRLSHLQLLTGSTLTILPLLEELVRKFAPTLTRRDASVSAVRVQLERQRLVGVRFPQALMGELRQALAEWQKLRSMHGSRPSLEAAAPINKRTLAVAMRPTLTMKSFFGSAAPQAAAPAAPPQPPSASRVEIDLTEEEAISRQSEHRHCVAGQSSMRLGRKPVSIRYAFSATTPSSSAAKARTLNVPFFERGDPAQVSDVLMPSLPSANLSDAGANYAVSLSDRCTSFLTTPAHAPFSHNFQTSILLLIELIVHQFCIQAI
ncbi:MAG: hypothetical protein SGPRY_008783 [Prymnesium sp.]